MPLAFADGVSVHRRGGEGAAAGDHGCGGDGDFSGISELSGCSAARCRRFVSLSARRPRSDFLRDCSNDGQLELSIMERKGNRRRKTGESCRQNVGLGKFDSCLMQPMANLHYVLAPAGVVQKSDLSPRWGLLSYGETGVSVVVKPCGRNRPRSQYVESAIARTLTGDIFRADDRAVASRESGTVRPADGASGSDQVDQAARRFWRRWGIDLFSREGGSPRKMNIPRLGGGAVTGLRGMPNIDPSRCDW